MKKVIEFIKYVIAWMVVFVSVAMVIFTVISVRTVDSSNRSIFGYKAYIVLSESMSKTDFSAGDLVVVQEVEDCRLLKEGDIISYTSQNSSNFGQTVTHKIRSLTTDEYGNPGFITFGTTTNSDDQTIVTYPYVLGIYRFNIPKVGLFFSFLKSPQGYIFFILIPFIFLIGVQLANFIGIFKKYKQEHLDEIENEKRQLQQEKEKNKKLTEEILRLKKELEEKDKTIELMIAETKVITVNQNEI